MTFRLPKFSPRAPWIGGDLQTLRNFLRRGDWPDPEALGGRRVMFDMEDGTGDRLPAMLHRPAAESTRPLVILVHGMSGCEESAYVLYSTRHFLGAGYPVLRLNLRGAGPAGRHCTERYHGGRTGDFRAVLGQLAEVAGSAAAHGSVALAYSLGANMVLKHLGERGAGLLAAVSVSAPIDLAQASARMLAPRNRAYARYLVSQLVRETLSTATASEAEAARLKACRSVLEFDEIFTAPRNGYANAAAYYAESSARSYMAAIETPTLVIHASNDPWIPAAIYAGIDDPGNPAISLHLNAAGGHVGFHGAGSRTAWHDRAARAFFEDVLDR